MFLAYIKCHTPNGVFPVLYFIRDWVRTQYLTKKPCKYMAFTSINISILINKWHLIYFSHIYILHCIRRFHHLYKPVIYMLNFYFRTLYKLTYRLADEHAWSLLFPSRFCKYRSFSHIMHLEYLTTCKRFYAKYIFHIPNDKICP